MQSLQSVSNNLLESAGNWTAQGAKRAISSCSHLENTSKKRMILPNAGKARRVPLKDSMVGGGNSQDKNTGEDRFTVVGSPHTGHFQHNRPPTAKSSIGMSKSRRSSQQRFLKRTEIMMVARFDQELDR